MCIRQHMVRERINIIVASPFTFSFWDQFFPNSPQMLSAGAWTALPAAIAGGGGHGRPPTAACTHVTGGMPAPVTCSGAVTGIPARRRRMGVWAGGPAGALIWGRRKGLPCPANRHAAGNRCPLEPPSAAGGVQGGWREASRAACGRGPADRLGRRDVSAHGQFRRPARPSARDRWQSFRDTRADGWLQQPAGGPAVGIHGLLLLARYLNRGPSQPHDLQRRAKTGMFGKHSQLIF